MITIACEDHILPLRKACAGDPSSQDMDLLAEVVQTLRPVRLLRPYQLQQFSPLGPLIPCLQEHQKDLGGDVLEAGPDPQLPSLIV